MGKKTFKNALMTGIICTVGAIIAISVVNLTRLPHLKTEIVQYELHKLENFEINPDTTFILRDTVKVHKESPSDSTENIQIKVQKVKKLTASQEKRRKDIEIKVDYDKVKLLIDTFNTIRVKYLEDGDEEVAFVKDNTIITYNNSNTYSLSYYKELYIGDSWTSDIGLPAKNEFYVLSVPKNDTLITKEVLKNYKSEKTNGNYIAKYNF